MGNTQMGDIVKTCVLFGHRDCQESIKPVLTKNEKNEWKDIMFRPFMWEITELLTP